MVCILILVKWVQVTSIFKITLFKTVYFSVKVQIWTGNRYLVKLLRKGAVINYVIVIPSLFIKFQLSFCPPHSKWCQRFIKSARLIFIFLDVLKYLGWRFIVTKILVTLLFAIFSYQTLHLGSKLITVFFVTIFCHPPVLNIIFFSFFMLAGYYLDNTLSIQLIRISPCFSDLSHLIVKIVIYKNLIK